MENNLEAFVKLKHNYEIIAEELESQDDQFIDAHSFLKKRTGFGSTKLCILCPVAIRLRDMHNSLYFCNYCMWSVGSIDTTAPCVTNNYAEIYRCTSTHQLASLLKERIGMMEKQIRISQG